jgi:hypothetical protein
MSDAAAHVLELVLDLQKQRVTGVQGVTESTAWLENPIVTRIKLENPNAVEVTPGTARVTRETSVKLKVTPENSIVTWVTPVTPKRQKVPPKSLAEAFADLEQRCPAYIDGGRWQQCVEDGRRFLTTWGEQAQSLGWTAEELFSLHQPPATPHPSYRRLSRYDCTGLLWLLQGSPVVALAEGAAAIESKTGVITVYRKHNKPGLGPLGDCLDDLV